MSQTNQRRVGEFAYPPEQIEEFKRIARDVGITYDAVTDRYRKGDRGARLARPRRKIITLLGKPLKEIPPLIFKDTRLVVPYDRVRRHYSKFKEQGLTDKEIAQALLDYFRKNP